MTERGKSMEPCKAHSWGLGMILTEPESKVARGALELCRFCMWGRYSNYRTGGDWLLVSPEDVKKFDLGA